MIVKKWWIFIIIIAVFSMVVSGFGKAHETKTRRYLTTGQWYPRTAPELNKLLDSCFEAAGSQKIPGKIKGIVSPHAGMIYSGKCAANAYKQLQDPALAGHINKVFILGVAHRGNFRGAAVSTFDFNSTPLGDIPVDTVITKKLAKEKYFKADDNILQYEHSIETQLPFLQRAFKKRSFKIVPILFGFLNREDVKPIAAIIKKYIDDKTLVIASTDFTHYGRSFGYVPFRTNIKAQLTSLDMGMIRSIVKFDLDDYFAYRKKTGITMCGFFPVAILMKIYGGKGSKSSHHSAILTDYYRSGDRENDYSLSVSYASIIISETGKKTKKGKGIKTNDRKGVPGGAMVLDKLNKDEQKVLLSLARETLELYLEKGEVISDEEIGKRHTLTDNLQIVTGVFVTLKHRGDLRGCIGSIVGREPLYCGVRDNAINAGVRDYRFHKVKRDELDKLDIEVSVMTPLQRIDDYRKIRLGVDGVIIKRGSRQAVFLPQVATETGWDLDEFLGHLCRKAGLMTRSYKENGMEFWIFQAQVFGEKEEIKK